MNKISVSCDPVDLREYLKGNFFYIFDLIEYSGEFLRIALTESESYNYEKLLIFEDPIMADCSFSWKAYGPDFVLDGGNKRNALMNEYGLPLDLGYHIFSFPGENFIPFSYTICAKSARVVECDFNLAEATSFVIDS